MKNCSDYTAFAAFLVHFSLLYFLFSISLRTYNPLHHLLLFLKWKFYCQQKDMLGIKNSHTGGLVIKWTNIHKILTFSNNLDASLCKIFLSSTWPPTRWTSSQALNRNEIIYREGIDGRDIFISDWFSSEWSCLTAISSHPCSVNKINEQLLD
jgi:hypothetical protein